MDVAKYIKKRRSANMSAILRIDVDRAYENRILYYAWVNQHFLLEKEPVLRKHVSIHLFGGDLT